MYSKYGHDQRKLNVKRLPLVARLPPAFYIVPHASWNYGIVTSFYNLKFGHRLKCWPTRSACIHWKKQTLVFIIHAHFAVTTVLSNHFFQQNKLTITFNKMITSGKADRSYLHSLWYEFVTWLGSKMTWKSTYTRLHDSTWFGVSTTWSRFVWFNNVLTVHVTLGGLGLTLHNSLQFGNATYARVIHVLQFELYWLFEMRSCRLIT